MASREIQRLGPPARSSRRDSAAGVWGLTAMGQTCIVVGAGSGGCVAAARLSEDRRFQVTLFEAGPDLIDGSVTDSISGSDFFAALAEDGRTYPDLVASRVPGGPSTHYQRGRGVGGSSVVNAMVALRGDTAQYEDWGWNDTVEAWDAIEIPEQVAADNELGVVDTALLAAAADAEKAPLTRANGLRVTSAEAYLWPALRRGAMTLQSDTPVSAVMLDDRRVIGVRLATGEEVSADRVILAAGAIHTPALLLRSGISGPGIGEGLQDHPSAPIALQFRDGVAPNPNGLAVASLLQRDSIQLLPMNHLGPDNPGMGMLMAALMKPVGRAGSVRLSKDDPLGEPTVSFDLLQDDRDLAALRQGVRLVIETLASHAFEDIVESAYIDAWGSTIDALDGSDAIEKWLRSAGGDYVHSSSSCAIGAALDQSGGVLGFEGLYVSDASAFPSIPSVNTHLPTTMLAERLTRLWRGAW